jgi:hypothetical protein
MDTAQEDECGHVPHGPCACRTEIFIDFLRDHPIKGRPHNPIFEPRPDTDAPWVAALHPIRTPAPMSEILNASVLKPNLGRRESDGHGLLNKQIENGHSANTDDYRDHTGCQERTHKPSKAVAI